jgi:hypothetical protein
MKKQVENPSMKSAYLAMGFAAIAIAFLFVGLPERSFYVKNGTYRWLPFIGWLVVAALLFLAGRLIPKSRRKQWQWPLAGVALACGIGIGLKGDAYVSSALEKNGVKTKGVVIQREKRYSRKSSHYDIQCRFIAENGLAYYTFWETDDDNEYHLYDTVTVRYDRTNPEISEVVSE